MTKARGEPASAEKVRPRGSPATEIRIQALRSIGEITAAEWNSCANPTGDLSSESNAMGAPAQSAGQASVAAQKIDEEARYNPFISHAFLSALEDSGSVGGRSGWQVQHLLVKTTEGELLGVAPCYAKSHSRGEYVFDRGWAEAYERAGGAYYPKLQVAVPFTPATGRRLLVRPGAQADIARQGLAAGLVELSRLGDASGVHVTFATEAECAFLGEHGFLRRTDQQFHWANPATPPSTTSLPPFRPASARPSSASGAMRWLPTSRTLSDRQRSHRKRMGRVLRVLYGNRLTQMGPALSDPLVLLSGRRADGRPNPAGDGQARRTLDRRCNQFHRLGHACSGGIGARSRTTRSCTSRSATIRPSNTPSPTSSALSKPARKASTRSRADTCRGPRTRRITSPIQACAAPSPITWCATRLCGSRRHRACHAAPYRKDTGPR